MKAINVKVPEPQSTGRMVGSDHIVMLCFDRPVTDNELRALQALGIGGFPTVCIAAEQCEC